MTQELTRPVDPVTDVLARIGRKGIRLWTANAQLHYRAAKGSLTDEEIETLRLHKDQIISMLERVANVALAEPNVVSSPHPAKTVLSFSQEAHWRRYKLHSHYASRTIASATRIAGRVNLDLFRDSIATVVRRHPGLRTRIVICDGTPMQQISELIDFKLEVQDLTALLPTVCELEMKHLIERLILEPIKVSEGPLWEARLLRIRNEEHVLIIVMEHIISDMRSMQILLRDIFSTYAQLVRDGRAYLPPIPIQFTEYADWQRRVCDSNYGRSSYWSTRLSGCTRVRFPRDYDSLRGAHLGWDCMRIRISSQQRANLSTWTRLRKTTPSMAVFTAYVALVSRWCNVSDIVISYTIDGRTSDRIQDAIGYFAKLLPVRVEIYRTDSFVTLLNRVTTEYCKAYEQADFCYLEAQVPAPDFLSNSIFNWIAQENSGSAAENVAEEAIRHSPIPFDHPAPETIEVDIEPSMQLFDSGREVSGGIYFPKNRFSFARRQKFASNFKIFMEALLERADAPVYDVALL